MTVLPGYEFASWDQGYGDIALQPDLTTLRSDPVARSDRARDVRRASTKTMRSPVEVSPRRILQRQVERAAALGYTVMFASELEFFLFRESLDEAAAKDYTNLTPHSQVIEDYHVLQTTRDEYLIRAIRNGVDNAGIPVEFSKGEAGRGQHEINLVYSTPVEMADRHVIYKNAAKEIASQFGRAITFMAKYSEARGRLVVPRPLERVERGRVRVVDVGCRRTRSPVVGVPRLARRSDRVRPRARLDVRTDGQLVQALPARVVGADRARVERRQPHVRVPPRRARVRRSGSSRGSPAPT